MELLLLAAAMVIAVVCLTAAWMEDRRARSALCDRFVSLLGPAAAGSFGAATATQRRGKEESAREERSADGPHGRRAVLEQRLDLLARKLDELWARQDAAERHDDHAQRDNG